MPQNGRAKLYKRVDESEEGQEQKGDEEAGKQKINFKMKQVQLQWRQ